MPLPGAPAAEAEVRAARALTRAALGLADGEACPAWCADPRVGVRFLRARGGDAGRACAMMREHARWRAAERVEEAYEATRLRARAANSISIGISISSSSTASCQRCVNDVLPTFWHKTSHGGWPVWYQRLANVSQKRLWQATTKERYIRWQVIDYERLYRDIFPALSAGDPNAMPCVVSIFDLDKIGMSQWLDMQAIVASGIRVASDNYPELMGALYVINAPIFFRCIWTVIRPLLDHRTACKIHIVRGGKTADALLETIPAENLPCFLGGLSDDLEDCLRGAQPPAATNEAGITPETGAWVVRAPAEEHGALAPARQDDEVRGICWRAGRLSRDHASEDVPLVGRIEELEEEILPAGEASRGCGTLSARIAALEAAAARCGLPWRPPGGLPRPPSVRTLLLTKCGGEALSDNEEEEFFSAPTTPPSEFDSARATNPLVAPGAHPACARDGAVVVPLLGKTAGGGGASTCLVQAWLCAVRACAGGLCAWRDGA